ncbi:hypothetical protein J6590_004722 [Homalodisca vitripennis]|nr:hypothetical protein J6590_004722 [Homalodisca vitripennis]
MYRTNGLTAGKSSLLRRTNKLADGCQELFAETDRQMGGRLQELFPQTDRQMNGRLSKVVCLDEQTNGRTSVKSSFLTLTGKWADVCKSCLFRRTDKYTDGCQELFAQTDRQIYRRLSRVVCLDGQINRWTAVKSVCLDGRTRF